MIFNSATCDIDVQFEIHVTELLYRSMLIVTTFYTMEEDEIRTHSSTED